MRHLINHHRNAFRIAVTIKILLLFAGSDALGRLSEIADSSGINTLKQQLYAGGSSELVPAVDSIIFVSQCLTLTLETVVDLLSKTVEAMPGDTDYKSDWKAAVNEIFIEKGNGAKIKSQILNTIDALIRLSIRYDLDVDSEELPLKLFLWMEKDGVLWEHYCFKDMPSIAVYPILNVIKNDCRLSVELLLPQISDMQK